MYKRTFWGFALTAFILGGAIYFLTTTGFRLGIDLRGGTELTYQLDLSRAETGRNVAEEVKNTVAQRLDIYGLKEISIAVQGEDRLVVQLPGASDSQEVENLERQIEQAGNLLFMLLAPESEQTPQRVKEIQEEEAKFAEAERGWFARKRAYEAKLKAEGKTEPAFAEQPPEAPEFIARMEKESKEENGHTVFVDKGMRVLHNGKQYKVSGSHLTRSVETYDQNGKPAVSFSFDQEGATEFANLTGPHVGRFLAILLDDAVRSVARIQSRISDQGQLTGNFSRAEVHGIVTMLRGGSLPTKPQLVSESTVGAVLGSDSIQHGAFAVGVGLLAVLAFMALYYLLGGMIANLALVINVIFILAFVVVFRQTLTFPGIAGILLTIGMAVDANILIFERVREELGRGKSLLHALGAGYQRAFWVIFDSNITTILSGVVLFFFGTGPVKGFAVTLIAGLVASFFTAVYVTRIILSGLYNAGFLKRLTMLRIFSPPRVDHVGNRRFFVGASVVIIGLTWAIFVIPRGSKNYGIDFTGGSRISMNLNRVVSVDDLRKLVDNLPLQERRLFKDYSIQTLDAKEQGKASSFSLLTRTEEEGVAHAQEKPATDKPGTEKPGTEKAGAEKAGTQPAASPGSAPAPGAPAEKPGAAPAGQAAPPAPAGQAPAGTAPASPQAPAPQAAASPPSAGAIEARAVPSQGTAEARRRSVLREMLQQAGLLLPDAFNAEWKDAPGGGQSLVLHVNLIKVNEKFNRVRDAQGVEKVLSTPDALKEQLNGSLAQSQDARLKAIRVESVETESAPAPAGGKESLALSTYRITTNSYVEPLVTVEETSRTAPRHNEVEAAIRKWFQSRGDQLKLAEPIPEVQSVGPKVAEDLQQGAIIAVFVAMLGIMFYMAIRFELIYGVAGIVALIHDVLITIGIMAATDALFGETFSIKINLPEIAAFLTIIGFSINDTIVVFDRVREILKGPKQRLTFEEVMNAAVNQTLSRTIWTSLTTLLVTLALLLFGGEPVRGFSYAFAIGVVTGTYSSIFIANPVVVYLHARQLRRREAMLAETAKA
jgi:SecD/SecF fusion protein